MLKVTDAGNDHYCRLTTDARPRGNPTNIRIYFRRLETTPWAIKKGATFIFTITLANVDRFQ